MCPRLRDEARAAQEKPLKSYQTILDQEIVQAQEELQRPGSGLFISGLIAGLGVGISVLLMAIVLTASEGVLAEPVVMFLVANAYTVGFIAVIMARTDLFTEYTTTAILPVLMGRASWVDLGRLWAWVYVANVIGAGLFAALIVVIGPGLGVLELTMLGKIAHGVVGHSWWIMLLSAVLAGWLMGLLSWLVTAGRDTVSQIFFVWVITFAIALGHLHHSITGTAEVLAGLFGAQGLGMWQFGRFLLWSTLGNAAGGVMFAVLIRYGLVNQRNAEQTGGGDRRPQSAAQHHHP